MAKKRKVNKPATDEITIIVGDQTFGPSEFMTIPEVAKLLSMTRQSVDYYCTGGRGAAKNELRTVRIGGIVLCTQPWIDAWKERKAHTPIVQLAQMAKERNEALAELERLKAALEREKSKARRNR